MNNTITNIISNLKKSNTNQDFIIYNDKIKMEWSINFEFLNNSILMICNGSTLDSVWFNNLKELNYYLKNSFLNDNNFTIK